MKKVLSAEEAAKRLGVKPATLYTYVSRGWLISLPGEDGRRRRYLTEEVEALRVRAESMRGHQAVAASAIRWGQPLIDTAISDIGPRGPRYRGRPVLSLLAEGFEAVAEGLWAVPVGWGRSPAPDPSLAAAAPPSHALHARLIALLGRLAMTDPAGPDAEIERIPGLLRAMALALSCSPQRARAASQQDTIAGILAVGLGGDAAAIDHALILCAEHGLNASTFTARVVASTGADLYACLAAAVAALSGPRHGAASRVVEQGLDHPPQPPFPGCGHRLYPEGDPRFPPLMALAEQIGGTRLEVVRRHIAALQAAGAPDPNLDLGLVALSRALGMPAGSGQALFVMGRTAGWIAHVLEERHRAALIRPRARYQPRGP